MDTFSNIALAAVSFVFLGLGALALGGCGKKGESGMEGLWYEQSLFGGTLTVTEDELIYEQNGYRSSTSYHTKSTKDYLELVPDDDWFYPDVYYYADEERLIMHTMPHTDGDGGYRIMNFLRSPYVAPTEPVYGERKDAGDPAAPKDFADHAIESLSLDVYEPTRQYGDMAAEQPYEGEYHYRIRREDDGGAVIEESPCPEQIRMTPEELAELEELIASGGLFSLNGVDVWTEGTPEDTVWYELNIRFAGGETYHSRANHKDVDDIWKDAGWELHQYIYEVLSAAGYNYTSGEFHSTEPMLRLGNGKAAAVSYVIRGEEEQSEIKGTAYEYTVSTHYTRFEAEGDAPEALMKTLSDFSEKYRLLSEQALKEDDEQMAAVPKSVWKKEDRCSARSFFSASRIECDGMLYSFRFDEGRVNSFGMKPYGYGTYHAFNVYIDAEKGNILRVADLFTDPDKACRPLYDRVINSYEEDTAEFQKEFGRMIRIPAAEGGLDFSLNDEGVTLIYQKRTNYDEDSIYTSVLVYYDELQNELNPAYAVVR